MIRIVMLGRLGNNLFQYALGRHLAEKHGVPLIMDGSWFNGEGWNQVKCLKRLPGPAAGKTRIVRRLSLAARTLLKATGRHYWEYGGVPVLRENEQDQSFDASFREAPADCVLFGYFQSPRYFAGFEDRLRGELSTHDLGLETGHEELASKLRRPDSVAVHVRRTDYSGNPNLDLCGPAYYQKSMALLRESLGDPRFHVFSDDPSWCRDQFKNRDVEVVSHAPPSALLDLHLMSLASHHIIANSSYSWWAAWLGKKTGQRVLMPSRWFGEIKAPVQEKLQPGWELIPLDSTSTVPNL